MPDDWSDIRKSLHAEKMVRKFLDGEEKAGWVTKGKPICAKIHVGEKPDGTLWTPKAAFEHLVIPKEHPWVDPDRDLYMIWVPMEHEPFVHRLEVPDDIVEEHVKEHGEWLPGWKLE